MNGRKIHTLDTGDVFFPQLNKQAVLRRKQHPPENTETWQDPPNVDKVKQF